MTEFEEVAARYLGRRVVVLASGDGNASDDVVAALIAAGAEVHMVVGDAAHRPQPGLASRNECDLGADHDVVAALGRIGAVVQYVFHFTKPGAGAQFGVVAMAAKPLMPIGGAIVGVGQGDDGPDDFVGEHASAFAADGIHLAIASAERALEAGLA